jgi:Mrp family chromosome partitioning ATPase
VVEKLVEIDRLRQRNLPAESDNLIVLQSEKSLPSGAFTMRREIGALIGQLRNPIAQTAGAMLHITSATGGEGVSTVARELAYAAASVPWCKPLLLDRNPGKNDQSEALGIPLPDLIDSYTKRGRMEIASVQVEGVSFHAAKLLADSVSDVTRAGPSNLAADLHDVLRTAYNLIIIDCAPTLEYPFFLPFTRAVPDVIMVIRAESTRNSVAARAKEEIERLGGRLVGVIMNRQRRYVPRFIDRML